MWYSNKFFKYACGVLLTLLIIFMIGKIDFFLLPFRKLVSTIFLPILIGGILYYVLRPLVSLLQKIRLPKIIAILVSFAVVIALFALISTYTGSLIVKQFNLFIGDFSKYVNQTGQKAGEIINSGWLNSLSLGEFNQKIADFVQSVTSNLYSIIVGFAAALANIGAVLIAVPFVLFFFLKDDHRFLEKVEKVIPKKHKKNIIRILKDIDRVLSTYIHGQMIVATVVGVLMFIGYLIIGLEYPLILAIFAMLTCVIPFFGAVLGVIPALLLSIAQDPFMAVKILIVMTVVQQVEGNLISPQIMGRSLHIHPLTVLLLLMIGVSLYGFLGILLIIPIYAALKATFNNIYKMYGKNFTFLE